MAKAESKSSDTDACRRKYEIITSNNPTIVNERVVELLNKNWSLFGFLQTSTVFDHSTQRPLTKYTQVMVKEALVVT